MIRTIVLTAALVAIVPADAAQLAGRASVVDGDTLDIAGRRVRLWGIDAAESAQTCSDAAGQPYRCGQRAALALADHLAGRIVSCSQKDVDQYRRMVAVCRVGRNDVGGWLVGEGLAVAYRDNLTYADRERAARRAKRGLWAGAFVKPWEWRRGVR